MEINPYARNTMVEAGVPVIPGSKEPVYTVEEGEKIAGEIGYPIIVKAALGGGGKGMRVAQTPDEFAEQVSRQHRKKRRWHSETEQCIWNIL